jgi:hypothetical protein
MRLANVNKQRETVASGCRRSRSRKSRNGYARCSKDVKGEHNNMSSRNLSRRLERLDAELAPPSDEPALTILLTSPGQPDQIIRVYGTESADRRRRFWPTHLNSECNR